MTTIVVLGATGDTGRHLVYQALDRGLTVRAVVPDPGAADFPDRDRLSVVGADVHDSASVAAAVHRDDILISGHGRSRTSAAAELTAGARAVIAAGPRRIVWLGASGTGASAGTTNQLTQMILRLGLGPGHAAKVAAETAILEHGGIVVHTGRMGKDPDDPTLTLLPVQEVSRTYWPTGASRATVARLMLDTAVNGVIEPGLHVVRPALPGRWPSVR